VWALWWTKWYYHICFSEYFCLYCRYYFTISPYWHSLINHRRYKSLPIDSFIKHNKQHIPTNIISDGQPLHGHISDKKSFNITVTAEMANCMQILLWHFDSQNSKEYFIFYHGPTDRIGPRPHFQGHTITRSHNTFGRTPLGEWSAPRRDLYPANNTHDKDIHAPGGIRNPRLLL